MESIHVFLAEGETLEACQSRINRFFEKNLLVRYKSILFKDEYTACASDSNFWQLIDWCQEQNQLIITELIDELQSYGFSDIHSLSKMKQDYSSKTLHTLTHILDGFFGIDSFFYNFIEDSHHITSHLQKKITRNTSSFWLIHVAGLFETSALADQVPLVRSVGK